MNKCDAVSGNMIAYKDAYNNLEGTFDGCEVKHVSTSSNDEADVLANIGSQCLPIPAGVFWEEISEISIKPKKPVNSKKQKKSVSPEAAAETSTSDDEE